MSAYLICNGKNGSLKLNGVNIFGRKVCILPIFFVEEDALEVLFAIEEKFCLKNHIVRKFADTFMLTEE